MVRSKTIRLAMLGVMAMTLCAVRASARSEIREYLLGDIDAIHYDGVGSIDDVYVSPALLTYLESSLPVRPFDRPEINTNVPFTFVFPLIPGEEVIGATLTFGLRAREYLSHTDGLVFFDSSITNTYGPYGVEDLGWWPYTMTGSDERSLDLADVLGDNLLFLLQDGQFDGCLRDDTGIDYALLTLEIMVPLLGDVDNDGDVDADDIDLLCANMGGDVATYDLDGDMDVDEDDLIYMVEHLVELQDGSGRLGTKRGDINLNGLANATDLAIMKPNFGQWPKNWVDGNANCDDIVNATDLAILAANFGFAAPTGSAVPEPITMVLLALGGVGVRRRKK